MNSIAQFWSSIHHRWLKKHFFFHLKIFQLITNSSKKLHKLHTVLQSTTGLSKIKKAQKHILYISLRISFLINHQKYTYLQKA